MKLALGTVQFGLDYGAFNSAGQVGPTEAASILEYAAAAGIDTLDTARAYGTSEAVLGIQGAARRFRVVTKVRALATVVDVATAVATSIAESREALRTDVLDTLLFHSGADLLGERGAEAWAAAEAAQNRGEARCLGVSVYSGVEALVIANRFPISTVQLPVSIFDQRAIHSGDLERLKARGLEIHARSVFLQGFALADPGGLTRRMSRFREDLGRFRSFAAKAGISPLTAALAFVLGQDGIDRVVIGVQRKLELMEALTASLARPNLVGAHTVASSDPALVNPTKW